MKQSHRILLNTAVTYTRLVITVPIGLLVTRYVFAALGEVDFGLYAALAASGVFLAIVNSALTTSAQRHLAYAIGEMARGEGQDAQRLRKAFRAVLALFMSAGPVVAIIGVAVAPVVLSRLEIPEDRMAAAWWVLHLTIGNVVLQTITTPYRAMLTAYQEMPTLAVIEVAQRCLTLGVACLLAVVSGDTLVVYCLMVVGLAVATSASTALLCLRRHRAARVLPTGAAWADAREVADFAGWTIAARLADLFRNRGALLLAGDLFSASAAAAFGLAIQLHYALYRVAQGLNAAILPAAHTQAGRQSDEGVVRLAIANSKYSSLLASLFFVPILLECEALLDWWLNRPTPEGTPLYVRLFCTMAYVGITSWGASAILQAKNQIRVVSIAALIAMAGSLSVAWLGCRFGEWPLWSAPVVMLTATSVMALVVRPMLAARAVGVSQLGLLGQTVVRPHLAIAAGLLAASAPWILLPEGFGRILTVAVAHALVTLGVAWFAVFTPDERALAERLVNRLRRPRPAAAE